MATSCCDAQRGCCHRGLNAARLPIPPDQSALSQRSRDGHREDDLYFLYKKKVDELYCFPNGDRIRERADWIVKQHLSLNENG